MSQKTKSTLLQALPVITIAAFFVAAIIYAGTEPGSAPPGGNVPTPLNVSINAQAKEGALVVGVNPSVTTGLIVQYGNVGIGTTEPNYKLHLQAGEGLMVERIANDTTTTNSYTRGLQIRSGDRQVNFGVAGSAYGDASYQNIAWMTATGKIGFGAGGSVPDDLVIDTNSNVGIGTAGPNSKLDVKGALEVGTASRGALITSSASDNFQIKTWTNTPNPNFQIGIGNGAGGFATTWLSGNNAGNVGIGTTNPGRGSISPKLDIATANVKASDTGDYAAFFGSSDASNPLGLYVYIRNRPTGTERYVALQSEELGLSTYRHLLLQSNGGNVGIGTTGPGYKLDVQGGQINASGGLCIAGTCKINWGEVASAGGWTDDGTVVRLTTASDNVGIGTTAPNAKLVVVGQSLFGDNIAPPGSEPISTFGGGSGISMNSRDAGYQRWVIYPATGYLRFWSEGDRMVIHQTSGNVGIGTTAPLGKLQVVTTNDTMPSTVTAWDARHFVVGQSGSTGGVGISYNNTSGYGIINALSPNIAWRNLVLQSGGGNVGIGTTTPSQKLEINGNLQMTGATTPTWAASGDINAKRLCIEGNCKSSWPTGTLSCITTSCSGSGSPVSCTVNCPVGYQRTGCSANGQTDTERAFFVSPSDNGCYCLRNAASINCYAYCCQISQ